METYKIGVIVGSLRKASLNRKLALVVSKILPQNFPAEFIEIGDLPLYNQDADDAPSKEVLEFKKKVAAVQGIIFVTPEYNRSIPGILKNALDQGSRPYGKNVWQGKPAAILGVSTGAIGTALAQQHLRNIMSFLNMPALNQPEVFLQYQEGLIDDQGNVSNEGTQKFLQGWADAYVRWVKTMIV